MSRFTAPNAYGLPTMLGKTVQSVKKQAPMFTITGRSKRGGFDEDLQRTPGPGRHFYLFKNSNCSPLSLSP